MASLPAYVCVEFSSYEEDFDASVLRTEMERGVPKQRVQNTGVLQKLACALIFKSKADIASFEAWYFDTIKRIGWFTMEHPRTGATITARLEGGKLGPLRPLTPLFDLASREVVFEYMR